MTDKVLVVNKIDKNGKISEYAKFVNKFSAKYNLTTLCMQMHGISAWWDEILREKYEREIFSGRGNKMIYFSFGDCNYSCPA